MVNGEEITRMITVNLTMYVYIGFSAPNSVSGDKNGFYPIGTGRIPFTWDFYFLSGRQKRVRVSFLHMLFFKCF